jgi:hypothetical protein
MVQEDLCQEGGAVGLRWGLFIVRFEWKLAIHQYLVSKELEIESIKAFMELAKLHPLKFDIDFLEAYVAKKAHQGEDGLISMVRF